MKVYALLLEDDMSVISVFSKCPHPMKVYALLLEDASDPLITTHFPAGNKDFIVATVPDEEGMLRLLKTIRPDKIIIDLTAPGFDGLKLIGEIRRSKGCAYVPLIVLIDRTSSLPEEALARGAITVVEKRKGPHMSAEIMRELLVEQSEAEEVDNTKDVAVNRGEL
jgi:DNA-binding response OmpR family regulator